MASNSSSTRRDFAASGLNQALKLLYRMAVVLIVFGLSPGGVHAQGSIDAANAVFFPDPSFHSVASVEVPSPVGPFMGMVGGKLRADVDGNGLTVADPEVRDHNGDGSRELPPGTAFSGNFQFTTFNVPRDVAIVATGPLTIRTSGLITISGAMRLAGNSQFLSRSSINLAGSAWLLPSPGTISFTTVKSQSTSQPGVLMLLLDE